MSSGFESAWEIARQELGTGGPRKALPLLELAWLEGESLDDSDLRKGDALYLLGTVLARLGEGERAESALSQALKLRIETVGLGHPLAAAVLQALGDLYRRKGDALSAHGALQGACEILHRLGVRDEVALQAEYALAMVLRRLGRFDEGLEHAGRAWAMAPEGSPLRPPLSMLLASLAQAAGETSTAAGWLEKALPLLPEGRDRERVNSTLVRLALADGRLDEAEARLGPLLAAAPGDSDLMRLRASLLVRRGDREGAAATLGQAREATSLPLERAAIAKDLGDLRARQERWDEAAALYEEALPESRGDAVLRALLRVALGNARFRQERREEARVQYRRAVVRLRRTPAAPRILLAEALRLLASALNSTGRPRKAEARVREALAVLEELPQNDPALLARISQTLALVLEELAVSYALQERFGELVQVLEQVLELRTSLGAAEDELEGLEDHLLTACLKAGQLDRGLEAARDAREVASGPARRARLGLAEARLLAAAGRRDQAAEVLDASLAAAPELADLVQAARRDL